MIGLTMQNYNAITLFGGSGDLTYRKLIPALYNLHVLGKLPASFKIIGIGRRDYTTDDYIEILQKWTAQFSRKRFETHHFTSFIKRIIYFKMDISNIEEYKRLAEFYAQEKITHNVYYYAVAPSFFGIITQGLKKYCSQYRGNVIIEKPFGEDLATAEAIFEELKSFFGENNVYHIDHYLGKEMIQNILSIRFKNAIFKGIWNHHFIDHIEISALESVGIGSRAGYYDKSGALKDMVQNHLLQLLSIVTLEESSDGDYSKQQYELLKSLKPIMDIEKDLVLGQYEGYLKEDNIDPNSTTETYAALKLFLDNERFKDVPIYIRTGKALYRKQSQVMIKFKAVDGVDGNVLIIKIEPEEGVYFKFNIKKPGTENDIQTVSMDFCQNCIMENRINTPEAYERLLLACMNNDRSLFAKWDQIVVSWKYMNDLIYRYQNSSQKLYCYRQGSFGPTKANELIDWMDEQDNENN